METFASHCPLDCPDACSLTVKVEGGRAVGVTGSERNPLTAGFLCSKVAKLAEHLYCPERLLHPAVRVGAKGAGEFRRIGWDEALDRVAAEMRRVRERWGGEAILPMNYGGSNGYLSQLSTDARLFHRIGASNLGRNLCAAPSGWAQEKLFGRMPGMALEDYEHSRGIVLWGVNPSATSIHLVPVLKRARAAGARLAVVDPRRIPLAGDADLHVAIRPGTDLPVALSLVRWLFATGRADLGYLEAHATGVEELRAAAEPWTFEAAAEVAGVAPGELLALGELFADSEPAAIRCGWGVERSRHGAGAVAAILSLPVVAGKLGRRGGGFTMSNSKAWRLDPAAAADAPAPKTRTVVQSLLGKALTGPMEPPVALLFVYNSNPLATVPEQETVRRGLLREDLFTVVFDAVMTDTARYADLLLPATTFVEHTEVARGYGAYVLQCSEAAVAAPGEARPNFAVFQELVERLGLGKPGDATTEEEFTRRLLAQTGRGPELGATLAADGIAFPEAGPRPLPMVDFGPRTADGRVGLGVGDRGYEYRPGARDPAFPLNLISPARGRTISSTFGQLSKARVPLAMHPEDARVRGLADGDRVRIHNRLGEVRTSLSVEARIRPGVVELPKGLWSHHTDSGTTANALIGDELTRHGLGPCWNDAWVEVEKVREAD